MDKLLLIKLINIYCTNSDLKISTTSEIADELIKIFKNANFLEKVQNSRYNWIEEKLDIVLDTILDFVKQLELVVV